MKVKCDFCGAVLELKRNQYVLDTLEAYCENCHKWIKRRELKCRKCGYTYHKPLRVEGNFMLWECCECGNIKRIYIGPRKVPERRMMPVGY